MKKRIKTKEGDLIKIPYRQGCHTYARILVEGSYAFYDCPSTEERGDYETIIQSDILFIARVNIFGVKEGYWTILINIPLEDRLAKLYPRYFNPNPADSINLGFYEVYREDIENAIQKD